MRKIKIGDKVICRNTKKYDKKDFNLYGAGWKENKCFVVNRKTLNIWDDRGDIYWETNNHLGIFEQGLELLSALTQSQRLNCQK